MFDEKRYQDTFSQIHAPEETLSEVLKMTNQRNHNVIRFTRVLAIAAVITGMLATTAFAYVGFTQYENPMQMLKTFFGGDEYHVDEGGFVQTEIYYDSKWDVVLPTVEQVPVDKQVAEQDVSPYISGVGKSITDGGDTLTVEAHLYDSATGCGIIYYKLENPAGVGGYNLQLDGEVWWPAIQRVEVYDCWGKSFIIEEETTDTTLSVAHYYSSVYGDEKCIEVGFGGIDKCLYLPLDDGGGMKSISLASGDIRISAIGMNIHTENMGFLRTVDTDGTVLPPLVDHIDTLTIRYQDGTEYTVYRNTAQQWTQNYKYCIQNMDGNEVSYSFNRLIDVENVAAVIINETEFLAQ